MDLSYSDIAYKILKEDQTKRSLHYRFITQKAYMEGFIRQLKQLTNTEELINKIFLDISEYTSSNCTIYDYSNIADKLLNYQLLEPLSLPGENIAGEEHYEFYLDEDKTSDLILDTFFKLVENTY